MSRRLTLDLRRCAYCGKIPRGKMKTEEAKRYAPYCSFNCQEWARLQPHADRRYR